MNHSKDVKDRRFLVEAALLAAIIIAMAAAIILSESLPVSPDKLQADVSGLRTSASAGRLLATQYMDGNLTDTFLRNNAELIYDQVKSIRKDLDSSDPQQAIVLEHWEARHYAQQLESAMHRMSNDSIGLGIERDNVGELIPQFRDLEDELKAHSKE